MDLDSLYPLVTEAIRRAEVLDDLNAPGAAAAYLDVSLLEAKLADLLPATDVEGAIARRGAVRAAIAAGDLARARELSSRYASEPGIDAELVTELGRLVTAATGGAEQRDRSFATRYPHVSATIGFDEIRRLARAWLQQGAPFPIG